MVHCIFEEENFEQIYKKPHIIYSHTSDFNWWIFIIAYTILMEFMFEENS